MIPEFAPDLWGECRRLEVGETAALEPGDLLVTRFSLPVTHMVVFLGLKDGSGVTIGDPLIGRESWTVETFEEKWNGIAMLIR